MDRRITRALFAIALSGCITLSVDASPAFPIGAYVSWERVIANSNHLDSTKSEYLLQMFTRLRNHGINTVWVTNVWAKDLPLLNDSALATGLNVYVDVANLEVRLAGHTSEYYRETIPQFVKDAAKFTSIRAWVLSDEPPPKLHQTVLLAASLLKTFDPRRMTTVVANNVQYSTYAKDTYLDSICDDVYPFFGPNDPNGPHTSAAKKNFYRSTLAAFSRSIRPGLLPMVMAQSYAEVWGPRQYDSRFSLIGLPGSYVHWVQPSEAEIRWEFWEAIRAGMKGVFFFTATPEPINPDTKTLPAPSVAWKSVLVSRKYDAGPTALLNPDLSVTKQLVALKAVADKIRTVAPFLASWTKSTLRVSMARPFSYQTYAFADGVEYLVVVNDDLHATRSGWGILPGSVRRLADVTGGRNVNVTKEIDGRTRFTLTLSAGAGAVFRIETDAAGIS